MAVAPVHGQNSLKPGIVREQQVAPGGLRVEMDFLIGESPDNVFKQRGGDDDIAHGAPLDDQDAADSGIGGQISAVTHGGESGVKGCRDSGCLAAAF